MKIGVIGVGNVGAALGWAFTRANHEVVYGSRNATRPVPYQGAVVKSVPDAVSHAELVVLATPFDAAASALGAAGDFGGRILVDATNPIGPTFELITLASGASGAEHVASLAPSARVVKGFNTTGYGVMDNPLFRARRALMLVAGDDKDATDTTAQLATDIGFEAVALRGLSNARHLEPVALLWIQLALQRGHGRNIAFGLAHRGIGPSADATVKLTPYSPPTGSAKKTITVVGAGNIGGALARGWMRIGHDVRVAVRDPKAPDMLDLVEIGAKAVPIDDAARGADVVALTVPAPAVRDVLARLGDLSGKVLVDCTNAIAPGMQLGAGSATSSSEQLAALVPGAAVVRAFNQQGAETLREARFDETRAASFVAADDDRARETVLSLSNDIGLDSIDAGPLASARLLDHVTLLWIAMSRALESRDLGLVLLRR